MLLWLASLEGNSTAFSGHDLTAVLPRLEIRAMGSEIWLSHPHHVYIGFVWMYKIDNDELLGIVYGEWTNWEASAWDGDACTGLRI
mmetsp:Transcript_20211/g.34846  ORF Transcript_20211/g.34846 Transcript_20211/m.34846 type:complete len:86 (-) Transcript_20211:197-454(-)